MRGMKRILIVVVALFAGALPAAVLGATSRSQKKTTTTTTAKTTTATTTTTTSTGRPIGGTVVLGATKSPVVSPQCPPDQAKNGCNIVLTRASALETVRDGVVYPTTVKADGQLVAFTVGLATISGNSTETAHEVIHGLDTAYGGVTLAAITVLKPGKGTAGSKPWTVAAVSPIEHLQPYLGRIVQFPLATPIPVTRGETVALTVPTWAPVLTYLLNKSKFAYRQSRKTNCAHAGHYENAQLTIGQTTPYKCDYAGTRVEYNVTEVLAAPYPKNYVHSTRRP
jgi:hypothetical protein